MKSPAFVLAALTTLALADQRGDTPDTKPSPPQEQLAKFHVPPGFEVQLVAAEPQIQKPINLNFDAAGRLWVTGSEMYPWPASTDVNGQPLPDFDQGWKGIVDNFKVGEAPQPSPDARDSVRILSDFDPTGLARRITVFADKLNIPSGIQPLPRKADTKGDRAIVYSIPNIWLLTDTDGDGFAEKREPLYTGFGYTDTHGGSSSYIYWIDGWIYGTHGFRNHSEVRDRQGRVTIVDSGNTYRFRPDGTAFEIYAHGQTNPFGLTFDPLGNLFSADSHSKPVYLLLRGGYYEGIGKQHDGLGFAPRITDDDHGSSSIAGIAYYADDKWPAEYRGNLFNGNPVTRRLNRDRLEWHGSTPRAIRMPDFLTCDDPWFRPVSLKLGPDGALYIADFYNPIIGHYEVPLTHPSRDHTHGRIWRVVYTGKNTLPADGQAVTAEKGLSPLKSDASLLKSDASPANGDDVTSEKGRVPSQKTRVTSGATRVTNPVSGVSQSENAPHSTPPDLAKLDAAGLVAKLADPSLEVRRLATNELVDRVGKDAGPLLKMLLQDKEATVPPARHYSLEESENAAGPALSAADRLGELPDDWLHGAVGGSSGAAVFFATKILAERGFGPDVDRRKIILDHLQNHIGEPERRIKRAIIELLGLHTASGNVEKLVFRCAPDAEVAKEDLAMIYAAKIALRNNLAASGGFREATQVIENSPWGPDTRAAARAIYADISLAVPTPDSAAFLLAHLERTKLETPRAGEYLKHAVLHVPAEKLDAVATLLREGRAPSRPTLPDPAHAPAAGPGRDGAHPSTQALPQRLALATNLAEAAKQRGGVLPAELTAWPQGVLLEALASSDNALAKRAIEAVRGEKFPAKLEALAAIVRDEKREGALRVSALGAASNLPESRDLFTATFADSRNLTLRKRAAELLAQNGETAAVLAALPQAPWELALAIATGLAKTDAGATALLDAVEAGKAPARVLQDKAVFGGFFARPAALQERGKALVKDLPPEDTRLDKVIAERAKLHRRTPGNAYNGSAVFQKHCAVCHRFRNVSQGNVGPNLDGMAARGPERLIEDILDPNRNLDPAFRQTIIETKDGETLAGANPREQGDVLTLTDATGKELNLPTATIKTRTTLNLSLMPPAFESTIAPDDFNDLLTYLLGVK